jgi:hypothetical protein
MAYTAGFSVNVGDPTKASDVTTLAANDDYLKAAVDGKAALSGSTNNTVATVTGANALIGEADLTFASNKLTVFGTTGTGTATAGVLNLSTRETTVVDADQLGRIDFQAPAETGADAILVTASIYAEADVTFDATNNATDIVLATAHDGAAAERLRITSQGEIGLAGANYGTDGQVLTSAGAGAAAAWETIPPGTTLSGSTDNTVATVTGANALQGEANLTFDGSTLGVSGVIAGTGDLTITQGTDTTTGSDPIAVFERTGSSQTGVSLKSNNIHGLILRADSAGFGAIHSKDDLGFYTGTVPGSTYGDVRMRIDAATGNVGIGTTSPYGRLNAHGAYTAPASGIGASAVFISSSDSLAADKGGVLQFGGIYNTGGDITQFATIQGLKENATNGEVGGYLSFVTRSQSEGIVERMRITGESGLVHIGDSDAPSDWLDVSVNSGGGRPARFTQKSSTGNILALEYSGVSPDDNTRMFLTASDGTANRAIIYSDGDVWTSDAGTLTSDERLKTNIVDASDKLADLMRVQVRNFEWTPEYHPNKVGEKKLGFIAQELETVFPSLISEHDIAAENAIIEQLYDADDDTQYYVENDDTQYYAESDVIPDGKQVGDVKTESQIPDGKSIGDVKTESQIPDGKAIGDVKVEAKAHEPTMRKAYKDAFTPILVKALQEVTIRLEAAEAEIAALKSA